MGVLFAIAVNLLLATLADFAIGQLMPAVMPSALLRLAASLLAGSLTALYVGTRGGIHAFIGGIISVPLLASFVVPGAWQVSILAGILCALGGAVTEILRRRR